MDTVDMREMEGILESLERIVCETCRDFGNDNFDVLRETARLEMLCYKMADKLNESKQLNETLLKLLAEKVGH